jgi:hypothetical protein
MPAGVDTSLVAVYVGVGMLALLVVAVSPKWLPALLVLVMPTDNFDLEGPVTLTLSKVVLLVFLITLPAQLAAARQAKRVKVPLSLCLFFLAVIVSTVASLASSASMSGEGFDLLRSPGFRPVVQILSLCLRASAFLVIQMWASDEPSWARVCKATVFVSTLIAAYGVYQFIGYYRGWPIMAIHRWEPESSGGYALFSIGSLEIFRVGSFVGEPKGAAQFLLPSVVLIMFARSTAVVRLRSWLTSTPILGLHVVAFILTFATSSFFGVFISLPILSYLLWRFPGRVRLDRLLVAVLFLSVAVGIVLGLGGGRETASEIYRARITERVGAVDSPERAALSFLQEHSRGVLTGIGWGNASFVLRPYFDPKYYRPLTVSLNSGYLQILLEGGILSLFAFLWFLGGSLVRAGRVALREQDSEHRGMLTTTIAVCVVVAAMYAFVGTESQIWVFWGLLISLVCGRQVRSSSVPVYRASGLFTQPACGEASLPRGCAAPRS